ncbi:phosphatase PAP2 family protein [Pantoea sp. SoEX]|uniref:phosphatase PAP2 family protein n=1 Tax=Pantoea sp. SoEX TaxID=2576763 RepID=UPI001358CE12|nr:phosphatase PAP2 family protein [Pantoea sp. SoEX]MXP50947.1 phosphatase PAP2 family protein [Pantoea sp. SoEX]
MFKILCNTTIAMLLLLILPITFWLLGWHWSPYKTDIKLIFLIMQTVNNPWVIFTNTVLNIWIFKCLHCKIKMTLGFFLILNIAIFVGQPIKDFIKYKTQETRPYVTWLEHKYRLNINKFYQFTPKKRGKIIANLIYNQNLPYWLKKHWIEETDFSFPSGHTVFTNIWAILIVYFLWPYRYYKTVITIFFWSFIITASRLLFGMHWIQDIIAANILAWILANIAIISIHYFFTDKNHKISDNR